MDAMDAVGACRGAPDVTDGVRGAIGGMSLLVIPNVVAESTGVRKELSGKDWKDLKTPESDVMEGMRALGVPVEFASLPDGVLAAVAFMHANARPGDAKLSPVDKMPPCAAAGAANVDVMTEDRALRDAVGAECGVGRACTSRKKYRDRGARTAWFIGVAAGVDSVRRRAGNGRTECRSGKVRAAALEAAGDRLGTVQECPFGKPGAVAAIEAFYGTALPDGCRRCGPGGRCIGAPDCACIYGGGVP